MIVRDEWGDTSSLNEGGNTGNLLVLHVRLGMSGEEFFILRRSILWNNESSMATN